MGQNNPHADHIQNHRDQHRGDGFDADQDWNDHGQAEYNVYKCSPAYGPNAAGQPRCELRAQNIARHTGGETETKSLNRYAQNLDKDKAGPGNKGKGPGIAAAGGQGISHIIRIAQQGSHVTHDLAR